MLKTFDVLSLLQYKEGKQPSADEVSVRVG